MQQVVVALPCGEARPVLGVVVWLQPLAGIQIDIGNNPVKLRPGMFRVLNPKPAGTIFLHSRKDHVLKTVHEGLPEFWSKQL